MIAKFKYSLLFERKINTSFDLIINVYAPLAQRAERVSDDKDYNLADVMIELYDEMEELTKNEGSDMVIHNYAVFNVDKQVRHANANIISSSKEFMKKLVF
jgi:dephospho-CoA kinase